MNKKMHKLRDDFHFTPVLPHFISKPQSYPSKITRVEKLKYGGLEEPLISKTILDRQDHPGDAW